ncbi:hypothetical protein F5X99DRAFT_236728 [Biscogniauxia marginata]|nr:hypothetical protein F5X99DRAFT_236728 [Biscogniauxia marginata]
MKKQQQKKKKTTAAYFIHPVYINTYISLCLFLFTGELSLSWAWCLFLFSSFFFPPATYTLGSENENSHGMLFPGVFMFSGVVFYGKREEYILASLSTSYTILEGGREKKDERGVLSLGVVGKT